jgi:hypothetical protein
MVQPLDVLLFARVLLPGGIQVRRRGLLAYVLLAVLLLAQVVLASRAAAVSRCSISSGMDVLQHVLTVGGVVPVR